jgi:hypothetical protein
MKRPLILLLLLIIFSFSSAQEYALGIKGGFNYYNIGDINSRGGSIQGKPPDEIFSPNKELGTQYGAFFNVALGNFFVRPEINFVSNKNNYAFPVNTSNWKTSKTDVPILVGYKILDPVAIYVGPTFSFFNDMTMDGANNTDGESSIEFFKNQTSFSFGIMVEFKRFGIDLRYETASKETEGEIGDNWHDFNFSGYGINIADIYPYKPSQISLSLNIFLFRTDGDEISDIFSNLFRGSGCNCYK